VIRAGLYRTFATTTCVARFVAAVSVTA
jgi:hypothetical protein